MIANSSGTVCQYYIKCSKNLYSKILISKKENTKTPVREDCLTLQNLLFPFASLVRRENKFRVFFLFLVLEILEHLPYVFSLLYLFILF